MRKDTELTEVWTCDSEGCKWSGTRQNCDSHIRQLGHAVSPAIQQGVSVVTTTNHTTLADVVNATHNHVIEITKDYGRSADDLKVTQNLDDMMAAVNLAGRVARGWKLSLRPVTAETTAWYRVEFLTNSMTGPRRYHFFFDFIGTNPKTDDESELVSALSILDGKGTTFGGNPYLIASVDGVKYAEASIATRRAAAAAKSDLVGYAPFALPENTRAHFDRLYGVDAHINRVLKAVELAARTDFRKRINTVLIGPPACGKTELCRALKEAVGEGSVYEVDATACTKAGVLQDLDNFEELPRVMIIEEIEKANSDTLSFLLGIMDTRGEINKTTARGKIERDVKMLVIATVNNTDRFEALNYGALASRFSNVIYFQTPDDELLTKILQREIDEVEGDGSKGSGKKAYKWIKPTLEFCHEVKRTDARFVTAVCLTGQDDLLTNEYQTDLKVTMHKSDEIDMPTFPA